MSRMTVQITLTERCNLNCVYCYEKSKSSQTMSFEVFKSVVAETFAKKTRFDTFEFDFHGGEIGIAFPELKKYCEWLWSQKWPKPYRCFATTNGTLIHGEVQVWFKKNSHRFALGLSLDGTPRMHNINRSGSYEAIDIQFFRETWPKQGCKMTVSPLTLPSLASGVKFLCELGFDVSVNLAYGQNWSSDLLKAYQVQLADLVEYFYQRNDLKVPNLLSFPIARLGHYVLTGKDPEPRWCGSGRNMICYSPAGIAYPCQMFMPSSGCGQEEAASLALILKGVDELVDTSCKSCCLRGVCPTCYGQNYLCTGLIASRPIEMCRFRKIEALASAKLLSLKIRDPRMRQKIGDQELQRQIAGILHICKSVKL